MTPEEHNKKSIQLRRALTRARTAARNCGTLAEKLEAQKKVKAASAALQQHQLNFYELTCYELTPPNPKPSLGTEMNGILDAFRQADREHCGRRITEASIVATSLRFRWQGSGKLGVVVSEIGIRDATNAEYSELEDAVELGQVEIYTMPLYGSTSSMRRIVLHQATGNPLDPNSTAARRQRERFALADAARQAAIAA